MIKNIKTYILLTLLLLCQNIMAQNKTPTTDSPGQTDLGIFALPPLERAVRCIKYYEGWHDIKRNYPYIGWGHRILPHEKFSKNLTYQHADSLLRSDLSICKSQGNLFLCHAIHVQSSARDGSLEIFCSLISYKVRHCRQVRQGLMSPCHTCGTWRITW